MRELLTPPSREITLLCLPLRIPLPQRTIHPHQSIRYDCAAHFGFLILKWAWMKQMFHSGTSWRSLHFSLLAIKACKQKRCHALAKQKNNRRSLEMAALVLSIFPQGHSNAGVRSRRQGLAEAYSRATPAKRICTSL